MESEVLDLKEYKENLEAVENDEVISRLYFCNLRFSDYPGIQRNFPKNKNKIMQAVPVTASLTIKSQNIGSSTKNFCNQMFNFDILDSNI